MRLTFLSHTAMGGPFVVGSHQLAKALAQRGNSVLHISAPLSPAHLSLALRDAHAKLRWRQWIAGGSTVDGVREVVPLTVLPWSMVRNSRAGWRVYSRCMLESPTRRLAPRQLRASDCILIDEPRFVGMLDDLAKVRIIYRATDLYAQQRNDHTIEAAERLMCARADVLLATSEPVAAHLARLSNRQVSVVTNGVEFDHFARPRLGLAWPPIITRGRRESRAIYVGAFDSRFGDTTLLTAARALRETTFVLAGPGSIELAQRWGLPNVVGLGPQSYEILPRILSECSVGLLPMSSVPENAGRSPMKLYEYLASGLTVAATSTEELRRRALPATCLAQSTEDFARAIASAFAMSKEASVLADALECARAQSWSAKASRIEEWAANARSLPSGPVRVSACP